jgi:hypothetical protein
MSLTINYWKKNIEFKTLDHLLSLFFLDKTLDHLLKLLRKQFCVEIIWWLGYIEDYQFIFKISLGYNLF